MVKLGSSASTLILTTISTPILALVIASTLPFAAQAKDFGKAGQTFEIV